MQTLQPVPLGRQRTVHLQKWTRTVCSGAWDPAICWGPSWRSCGKRGLLRWVRPHTATGRAQTAGGPISLTFVTYLRSMLIVAAYSRCGRELQASRREGATGFQKPSSSEKEKQPLQQRQESLRGPSSVPCLTPETPQCLPQGEGLGH